MRCGIYNFGANATQWHAKRDKQALSQGAWIVLNVCREGGHDVVDLCQRWQPVDVLMFSLYWWEHLYDLVAFLAAHGIDYRRTERRKAGGPLLFLGGALPSYNPAPVREIADLVCIGDGEKAAPAALDMLARDAPLAELAAVPGLYVSELDNRAVWQQVGNISGTLRWPFVNRARRTGRSGVRAEKQWERRIEIARGCRRKCLFCGVSWTKAYRENDPEAVAREVRATGGCVKCFAPDLMTHSGWPTIWDAYAESGRYNQARDISTRTILRQGFGRSRSYSTGIDGLSERIRRALSKPLTDGQLVEVLERANAHMGSLSMYMILGLPGETTADVQQWFHALCCADLVPSRQLSKTDVARGFSAERFYAIVTLNAFCPTPHTPLQWAGIDLRADLLEHYMGEIGILGAPEKRALKHKLLGRPHRGVSRLLESAALRGGPQVAPFVFAAAKLRSRWTGANGLHRALQAADRLQLGEHLAWTLAEKQVGEPLPWVERVEPLFSQDALARAWAKYRRQMEMN